MGCCKSWWTAEQPKEEAEPYSAQHWSTHCDREQELKTSNNDNDAAKVISCILLEENNCSGSDWFPGTHSSSFVKPWWFLQRGRTGKECTYAWQRASESKRNELSGLLKRLHFSVQNQEPFIALHLKSSRKPLPQTWVSCQLQDRYSILCWFWTWGQYWPNAGSWVAALHLERQTVLLNAFKHFQPFGWKMLTPVLPLLTWSKTAGSGGPAEPS